MRTRDARKRLLSGFLPPGLEASRRRYDGTTAPRRLSVYDAVAGRASAEGWRGLRSPYDITNTANPLARYAHSVAPDMVLSRRELFGARYQEDDFYYANERLGELVGDHHREGEGEGEAAAPPVLPDSDLLKAVHAYAADFYANVVGAGPPARNGNGVVGAGSGPGDASLYSMDHSALLAFGILLEEAAAEELGATGDMVLVEGVESDGKEADEVDWSRTSWNADRKPGRARSRSRASSRAPETSRRHSRRTARSRSRSRAPSVAPSITGWKQDEEMRRTHLQRGRSPHPKRQKKG